MAVKNRTCALLASGAIACSMAFTGGAQAADNDTAAQSPDDGGRIADIVVTARRVSESQQRIPVAVTALSGADLVNRSMQQLGDVQAATPSLTVVPAAASPTSIYFSIRGQVLADIKLYNDPTVGVYLDDVYLPRAVGINAGNLIDLDRIEVLKGPQGTLFGRNTTGGAITIHTRQPADILEGQLSGRLGTYGDRAVSGVLNVPLAPELAIRLVGERHLRDGFGHNEVTGEKFGARDGYMLRGTALWQPADDLTLTVRGDYARDKATSNAWRTLGIVASSATTQIMREADLETVDEAMAAYNRYNGYSQDGGMTVDPLDRIRVWGVSGTIEATLGAVDVKSITAWRGFRRNSIADLDGSPFTLIQFDFYKTRDRQFSQEIQISSALLGDAVNWIAGGYYSRESGSEISRQTSLPNVSATNPTLNDTYIVNKAIGAFAQVAWAITPQLSATGGLRYSKDDRSADVANRNSAQCLSLGRPLADGPCATGRLAMSGDDISYTASVEYKPTGSILAYVKTSRSFRSGGISTTSGSPNNPVVAAAAFAPYWPEYVTDYEAGLKMDLFDRRLRINAAYFHSDYSDIQRSEPTLVPGTTTTVSVLRNIAAGKVDGVEMEVTARPLSGVDLRATGSYLDARYTDYTVGDADRSGHRFQWVPKWSWSLSGAYTHSLSDMVSARAQLDYAWQDDIVTTTQAAVRDAFGLLNARVSFHFEGAGLDVAFYGRNLTRERYYASPVDLRPTLGAYSSPVGDPRTFGFELTKQF